MPVDDVDQLGDLLLGQQPVDQAEGHRCVTRQHLGQDHAARGRLDHRGRQFAVVVDAVVTRPDLGVQGGHAVVQRVLDLTHVDEDQPLSRLALGFHGQVVEAEHDVLRGHDDRLAVGRRQDVVGRHHQDAALELGLQRQRHVDRHLVAVEVGVEGGADQRVQLDRLALDEDRLEGLNA